MRYFVQITMEEIKFNNVILIKDSCMINDEERKQGCHQFLYDSRNSKKAKEAEKRI